MFCSLMLDLYRATQEGAMDVSTTTRGGCDYFHTPCSKHNDKYNYLLTYFLYPTRSVIVYAPFSHICCGYILVVGMI